MLTSIFFTRRLRGLIAISLLGLTVSSGCSKEKMKKAYQSAKEKTEEITAEYTDAVVAKVEEQLPEFGSISLRSRDPIEKTKSANIELIDIGDGRPVSVQISSYDTSEKKRSYPAIHFHGQTSAKTFAELASTTISCDMYLQTVSGGRIAITPDGESARLKFGNFDSEEGTIEATLSRTELILSNDTPFIVSGGDILATIKEQ